MNSTSTLTPLRFFKQTNAIILTSITLAFSQNAFSAGGGIVTDDPSSLYSSAKKETYCPTLSVTSLIVLCGVIHIYIPLFHLMLVLLGLNCYRPMLTVLPKVKK
jgi:hypothetical protein